MEKKHHFERGIIMTNRQAETSREIRLWVRDIIVPVVTTAAVIMISVPGVGKSAMKKCTNVKNSIKNKLKKTNKKEKDVVEIGLDDNVIRMFNTETGEYRIKRR